MRMAARARLFAFPAALVLMSAAAFAAAPRFTQILPRGVQRGTEVDVTLSGTNLEDAEELLMYDSGMEVVSFEVPTEGNQKGRQVKVKLKIAADCPLGTQRLRVRTRTGISELQNLFIGPLPVVEEKEPNTDFESPQAVALNHTIQGRIDREDVDYYVVEAKKGQRLTAEVFGMRLGYSNGANYFDPYVAIMNMERFEIAATDDTPLVWNDAVTSLIVPEDGKYVIQLRDAAYQGDGRAYYLLSVGDFPRPQAVIPSGGKPGEKLTVTFVGDVKGPITQEITLPTTEPERFGLVVQDEYGTAPSLQPFRISPLDAAMEQEPNNDRTTASAATAPGAFHGVIQEPGDVDFFKFAAKKDQVFEVQAYARRLRSPLDAVVNIYQADGKSVGGNDDQRGPDSRMDFKAPADGEYVLSVRDHLGNGGPIYSYRIELTPKEPSINAQPIEFARYQQPDIEIPQGGGSGIVVTVRREQFGGPVNFKCDDLPAGVRIECPAGWREEGEMPVVFYAADDAPIAGKHCNLLAYLDDPKQADKKISGPVYQDMLLTRGQNNNRVWEERINRIPIVVTEKLPFKVWIETPKVPIVRGGSLNLLVKCEKAEGWDEDISIQLLRNPSGVSSSGSVKIPKGQTEAHIPMNAAGNARPGETMIALRVSATVGNGLRWTATPFVPFRVEEQYMQFKFAQGAVEQGKEVPYPVTIEKRKDFEGEAEVKLVGLPANATAEPLKVTKDTKELLFTIKAAANTPAGMTKNLFCQVLVPEAGETIVHNLGSGVLRVDPPPPAPKTPAPEKKPEKVADAKPAAKPLSRLEQLRLQQKEREAGGGGE